MKTKVRLVKKEDRDVSATPVESEAAPNPKEWSTAVKSWVKEFQKDQDDGPVQAFDNLFSNPKD